MTRVVTPSSPSLPLCPLACGLLSCVYPPCCVLRPMVLRSRTNVFCCRAMNGRKPLFVSHPRLFYVLLFTVTTPRTIFLISSPFFFRFSSCPAWIPGHSTLFQSSHFFRATSILCFQFLFASHPRSLTPPPRARTRCGHRDPMYVRSGVIIRYRKAIHKHPIHSANVVENMERGRRSKIYASQIRRCGDPLAYRTELRLQAA